ncbi:YbaK/EbsC family protein [Manganibacter manganicus]|uniref:YbaK/EbsC family protein n=1 Tax=Manganibacter manganicus TaxID=1873176 RepID=UPI001FD9373F|nr:YbaK/EbsC family protein [Pseudaminobacter manganicus]
MAGTFTKNLLLKDKKGRLFLFSIHEDRALDLKTLHQRVGASGRLASRRPSVWSNCSACSRAHCPRSD